MLDFHTHILPKLDDGSRSAEESVRMIEMLIEQGVDKILLTPHFYAYVSSASTFIEKRADALTQLLDAVKEKELKVELYLGCEVLYFEELWRIDALKDFCIQGTNYIMVELPFAPWNSTVVEVIGNVISKGFVPVIAHFERYIDFKGNMKKIHELTQMGALLQMNCSYINRFLTRGRAVRYIKKDAVFAIGSDCHHVENRAPNCGQAIDILKRKLGSKQYEKFISRQNKMIKQATKVYPTI